MKKAIFATIVVAMVAFATVKLSQNNSNNLTDLQMENLDALAGAENISCHRGAISYDRPWFFSDKSFLLCQSCVWAKGDKPVMIYCR